MKEAINRLEAELRANQIALEWGDITQADYDAEEAAINRKIQELRTLTTEANV